MTDANRTQPKGYVSPVTNERAKALTLGQGGNWNERKGAGRNAGCFACGVYDMAVSAKPKGVVMCCNACGAGKRDSLLLEGAIKAGFECGPGPDRRQGRPAPLMPASEASLAGLKPAERRVLAFCAQKAKARDWLEVSQREIVTECGGSKRDAIPLLNRLADRGLIRVRSNGYKAKRRTQIAFVVDPLDLGRRFATMVSPPEKMVSPWNGSMYVVREIWLPTFAHGDYARKGGPGPLQGLASPN